VLIVLVVVVALAVPTVAAIVHCGKRQPKILPSVPVTDQKELQTDPIFFSELECAVQCPLDVVFLVDSSASVGESGFRSCISFLRAIVSELEMPPVNAGLVRFHHDLKVISDLTGVKDAFLHAIANMAFDPGETKLAAPLRRGADMLRSTAPDRKKVIVVVTDGDPNDLDTTKKAAKACKDDSIELVFVVTGRAAQMHIVNELASLPTEKNVITLPDHDALAAPHAAAHVLRCIVEVAMRVRRAKCAVSLDAFHVKQAAELNTLDGFDVMCPGWVSKSSARWSWEPTQQDYLENVKIRWNDELTMHGVSECSQLLPPDEESVPVPPLPPVQAEHWHRAVRTEVDMAVGTERRASAMSDRAFSFRGQVEKPFRVRLGDWQNAPLDLVICLDSSASFFLAKRAPTSLLSAFDVAFSQSGAFQQAKKFVENLAERASFPGVRMGLIRFDDAEEGICPLTDDVDDFLHKLREMEPKTGETKLTPALRKAWSWLSTPHTYSDSFGEQIKPSKAVLVITDGDPNDSREAAAQVEKYKSEKFQLLYLKVGQVEHNDRDCLEDLSVMQPPPGTLAVPRSHRGVYRTTCREEGILDADILAPQILSQVLWWIRPVERALCVLPLNESTCEVVEEQDLSNMAGHKIHLDHLTPPLDRRYELWPRESFPSPEQVESTKPFPAVHQSIPRAPPSARPDTAERRKQPHSCTSCEAAAVARLELRQQLADAEALILNLKAQLPSPGGHSLGHRESEWGEGVDVLSAFIRLRSDVEEAEKLKLAAEARADEVRRELTMANEQLKAELAAAAEEIENLKRDSQNRQKAFEKSLEERTKAKGDVEALLIERAEAAEKKATASTQSFQKLRGEHELLLKRQAELEQMRESEHHAAQGLSHTVATVTRKNELLAKDLSDKDRVVAENLLHQERAEKLELENQKLKQENEELSRHGGFGNVSQSTAVPMGSTWQSESNLPSSPFGGHTFGGHAFAATILTQDGGGDMLWVNRADLRRCLDEWEAAVNKADSVEDEMHRLENRIVRMADASALAADPRSSSVTLKQWLDSVQLSSPPVVIAA